MSKHVLKMWPEPFGKVVTGRRKEIRKDGREFQTGDILEIKEWCPKLQEYTGRFVTVRVRDITSVGIRIFVGLSRRRSQMKQSEATQKAGNDENEGVVYYCRCKERWWAPKEVEDPKCPACLKTGRCNDIPLDIHLKGISIDTLMNRCLHWRCARHMAMGKLDGLKRAQKMFMDQSSELFLEGKEEESNALRAAARSLNEKIEQTEETAEYIQRNDDLLPEGYWIAALTHVIERDGGQ